MPDNDRLEELTNASMPLSRAKSRDVRGSAVKRPSTSLGIAEQGADRASVDGSGPPPAPPAGGRVEHEPERRCVVSGERAPKAGLIRLALGPDGTVAPDVRARAPGRGAWIGVDRAALESALAKGKLKSALQRAFKTAAVIIPDDLPARIEAALERHALDRLGLEARAGTLVTGAEKIADAARKGGVALLLHAQDAAADGARKLDQALRVGLGREGEDVRGLAVPAGRLILSMALGRENVVHIALIAPAAAARVSDALGRWRSYIGLDDDAAPRDSSRESSASSVG